MADQNNVQVTITAQDQISPTLRQISQTLQQLGQQADLDSAFLAHMATGLTQVTQAASGQTQATNQLATSYVAMAQAIQQQTQAYAQAEAAALRFRQEQAQAAQARSQDTQQWTQALAPLQAYIGGLGHLGQAYVGIAAPMSAVVEQAGELTTGLTSVISVSTVAATSLVALGAATFGLTKQYVDNRLALRDMHLETGMTLTQLQALTDQARRGNIEFQNLGTMLIRFNANMAQAQRDPNTPAGQALFGQLRMTREDLADPFTALMTVLERMGQLDPSGQGLITRVLFGRTPAELFRLRNQLVGENRQIFEQHYQELLRIGEDAFSRSGDAAQAFNNRVAQVMTRLEEMWRHVMETVGLPVSNAFLDFLEEVGTGIQEDITHIKEFVGWVEHLGATVQQWLHAPAGAPGQPSRGRSILDAMRMGEGLDVGLPGTTGAPGGAALPQGEREMVQRIAREVGVDPDFLAAIRRSEAGRPGREFGVLSMAAPRFEDQARIAAQSIAANRQRFEQTGGTARDPTTGRYSEEFIRFFSSRYAPIGAANDPGGLNAAHATNLLRFYGTGASAPEAAAQAPQIQEQTDAIKDNTQAVQDNAKAKEDVQVRTPEELAHLTKSRDLYKAEAEQLEQVVIQRKAEIIARQQGAVAAEAFTRVQTQAMRLGQLYEQQRYGESGRLPVDVGAQMEVYRRRVQQLAPEALGLTGQQATFAAQQQIPALQAELGRLQTFTGRGGLSEAERARAQIVEQGAGMRAQAEQALQTLQRNPALEALTPGLTQQFQQQLAAIDAAVNAQAESSMQRITERIQAQIDEIGQRIGAAGVTPLDAKLAQLTTQFTKMREELTKLKDEATGTQGAAAPQLQQIDALLARLDPALAQGRAEAIRQARDTLTKQVDDLSLQLSGAAGDARERQRDAIERWGTDLQAKISELQATLPTDLQGYRDKLSQLLTQVPQAVARRQFEQSDAYKMLVDAAHGIEQVWSTMWTNIFDLGVTKGKDFGTRLLQALQSFFSQLAMQMMNALLNAATGTTNQTGGWQQALVKVVGGLVGGLLGSGGSFPAETSAAAAPYSTGVDAPLVQIARAQGGLIPALRDMSVLRPLALQRGGIVTRPSFATLGEVPGQYEAVVPLPDNRSIPVRMQQSQTQQPAPIVIEVHQDFTGAIDPRALFPTRQEVVPMVVRNIETDGPARRVILRHATR
jgi:hypothetical protein